MYPLSDKTAGPIGPKFCRPKEGLWLVKVEKCCPKYWTLLVWKMCQLKHENLQKFKDNSSS